MYNIHVILLSSLHYNMVWCVPGGGGYCRGILCIVTPSHNSAREVIDAPLPQQDYVASLPPPPGGATTARVPSMFALLVFIFFIVLTNRRKLYDFPRLQQFNQTQVVILPPFCIECDQKFVSTPDGPLNGTFYAPTLINPELDPRQCVYTFLAGPRQRVELIFTSFGLRGKPPE